VARFLKPPDLNKAVDFVHIHVDQTIDLVLAEPLTGPGGQLLGVYVDNGQIAEVMPAAAQQSVGDDGLSRFRVKGKLQGICMLYARLGGPAGPVWGKTQVVVATVFTTTRTPAKIGQRTPWLCWAAATESFLQMQPYGARWSQDDLRRAYATWEDGGLEPVPGPDYPSQHTAEALLRDLGFTYRVMPGASLTTALIEDRVRRDRAVIMLYNTGPHVGHAVIVYGIIKPPQPYSDMLMVMDPQNGGEYREMQLSDVQHIAAVVVGWLE
jgi:hypothetical protein